jgi:hypothetical protein
MCLQAWDAKPFDPPDQQVEFDGKSLRGILGGKQD